MDWKSIIKNINSFGYPIFECWSAGKTELEAIAYARKTNLQGSKVSLNFLGEKQTVEILADKTIEEYLKLIKEISENKINADVTIKLSQVGFELPINGKEACEKNVRKLVKKAKEYGIQLWIDMEYAHYVDYTLELYKNLISEFDNVGVALQANLKRTEDDLKKLSELSNVRVRLVKGIYPPPVNEGYTEKKEIDESFGRIIELALSKPINVAVATHDEKFIDLAEELAKKSNRKVEIQMLKGVRNPLQEKIVKRKLDFNIYAPYGQNIFAYGVRRAREDKANSMNSQAICLFFGWIYNKVH